ncbi:MAG: hypothetical protein ABIX44_00340 [Cryobacterium sp.]
MPRFVQSSEFGGPEVLPVIESVDALLEPGEVRYQSSEPDDDSDRHSVDFVDGEGDGALVPSCPAVE